MRTTNLAHEYPGLLLFGSKSYSCWYFALQESGQWPGGQRHSAVSWRAYYVKNADRFDSWVRRVLKESDSKRQPDDREEQPQPKRRKLQHQRVLLPPGAHRDNSFSLDDPSVYHY